MFDIGMTEMLVVAIVAIVFIGPKELPGMLRTFGRTMKTVRGMAGDFQKQFDQALKDAELDEVKNAVDGVRNLDPTKQIKDKLNPLKDDPPKTPQEIEAEIARDYAAAQAKLKGDTSKSSGPMAVPGFTNSEDAAKTDAADAPAVQEVAEVETDASKPAPAKAGSA